MGRTSGRPSCRGGRFHVVAQSLLPTQGPQRCTAACCSGTDHASTRTCEQTRTHAGARTSTLVPGADANAGAHAAPSAPSSQPVDPVRNRRRAVGPQLRLRLLVPHSLPALAATAYSHSDRLDSLFLVQVDAGLSSIDAGPIKYRQCRTTVYMPLAFTAEQQQRSVEKPIADLELEFVYGYSANGGACNLLYLSVDEIVYYTAGHQTGPSKLPALRAHPISASAQRCELRYAASDLVPQRS